MCNTKSLEILRIFNFLEKENLYLDLILNVPNMQNYRIASSIVVLLKRI